MIFHLSGLKHVWKTSVLATALFYGLNIPRSASAQLLGHGGPVRSLAVSPDGTHIVSGSFDTSAIFWSLPRNTAEQVLRFHESAVNAVAMLPDGRIVTGGEDSKVALWQQGEPEPLRVFSGHTAPIVALAVSPDGKRIASGSWDRSVRVWWVDGGEPLVLEGHQQNVNGIAFTPDGTALVSVSHDPQVRIWPLRGGPPTVISLTTPLNAMAVGADGEIIAGGADGTLFFFGPTGEFRGELSTGEAPLICVTLTRDGRLIAAAGVRGAVVIVDRGSRIIARTLVGPGFPVWAAAFLADSRTLITGGADGILRRWDAMTGSPIGGQPLASADPLAAYSGNRGAEVYRACVACHTLTPGEFNRAGPTLHGIFGRRIASLPNYNFSPALKKLDIVWTPETISRLFELGPMTYTPGTKMPEQQISSSEDRAALIDFLKSATK